MGGMGFGILPAGVRRRRWAGAAYGLAILGVFEVAAAQWLGIGKKDRAISDRFALAGEHVLYGIVLVDETEGPAQRLIVRAGDCGCP
jgi:hypothetical protein